MTPSASTVGGGSNGRAARLRPKLLGAGAGAPPISGSRRSAAISEADLIELGVKGHLDRLQALPGHHAKVSGLQRLIERELSAGHVDEIAAERVRVALLEAHDPGHAVAVLGVEAGLGEVLAVVAYIAEVLVQPNHDRSWMGIQHGSQTLPGVSQRLAARED